MATEEKFNQIYQTIVSENTEDMEIARGEARVENRHNMFVLAIIIIINIVFIKLIGDSLEALSAVLIFISMLGYAIFKHRGGKSKIEKYRMDFKTKIVGTMIKSFEEQLEFIPQNGLPSTTFGEAEFESFDRYYSEDLIQGILKNNCNFSMAEVLTQNEYTDSDGNTSYSTVFSGLFAKIETPKPFNTLLYLRKDKKGKNLLARTLTGKLPFDKLRIQLDSPEFEKIFDVYASDKIIALQLLTADIMEDLMQFYNEMKMNYELTIKENCMYIRFWCGSMFETAKLKKFSLDRDTLYKYYRMLDFTFCLTNKMVKLLNETQYD